MRRLFFAALAALMLATALPAAAITYGQPDGKDHPNVGLVAFYDDHGTFIWRCSGTLLSSNVFLTAGHCTAPDAVDGTPVTAQVWMGTQITVGTGGSNPLDLCHTGRSGYPCTGGDAMGTPVPDLDFHGLVLPNSHDVGVVILDGAGLPGPYAKLAPLHTLDTYATQRGLQDISLTAVGYGLYEVRPTPNSGGAFRTRFEASQQIKDLRSALTDGYNVGATNAPGNGLGDGTTAPGGTCNGDSGGPVFHQSPTGPVIVAITSFGLNTNCKGGDYAFRTDIEETQAFVNHWLALYPPTN